jgi:hypothetical protein
MPTAVAARKREAQAQAQTKITILFWLIVCLGTNKRKTMIKPAHSLGNSSRQ